MRKVKFLSVFVLLVLVGNVVAPGGALSAGTGSREVRWLV